MNRLFEQERLKTVLSSTAKKREWAAKEFDTAQKQVIIDRSAFFDKLVLFQTGAIAATITFSGVLHQLPKASIQWKPILFSSWIVLFLAMLASIFRNWQAQNAWYYTTASIYEKHEGDFTEAYAGALTSAGAVISQQTGAQMNPSKIREDANQVVVLRQTRSKSHQKLADRSDLLRRIAEVITLIATVAGVALALLFAMHNFA